MKKIYLMLLLSVGVSGCTQEETQALADALDMAAGVYAASNNNHRSTYRAPPPVRVYQPAYSPPLNTGPSYSGGGGGGDHCKPGTREIINGESYCSMYGTR